MEAETWRRSSERRHGGGGEIQGTGIGRRDIEEEREEDKYDGGGETWERGDMEDQRYGGQREGKRRYMMEERNGQGEEERHGREI